MTRTPTDREILRAIYELYYAEFVDFDDKPHSRATKVEPPRESRRLRGLSQVSTPDSF